MNDKAKLPHLEDTVSLAEQILLKIRTLVAKRHSKPIDRIRSVDPLFISDLEVISDHLTQDGFDDRVFQVSTLGELADLLTSMTVEETHIEIARVIENFKQARNIEQKILEKERELENLRQQLKNLASRTRASALRAGKNISKERLYRIYIRDEEFIISKGEDVTERFPLIINKIIDLVEDR